jgi:DNA polymerase I-like protein with 3'-5' exonuclease and polymerase domains
MYTGFICSGVMRKNEIVNYPIQGSAFHCLLKTFIKLDERMRKEKWNSHLIGQIHDSLVMDVDPNELDYIEGVLKQIVSEELPKEWPWIIVPLEIEVEVYGVDQPWVK